ncbi:MAG: monofunctional biosynthetic peptidoglycan transglycosylase [Bacteroidia bacterium]|nr:monofunctional biosynthetic peptidoglycan transglycosylase [Bacteroidia bacterium]
MKYLLLKFLPRLVGGVVLLSVLWVVAYRFVPVPITPLMVLRMQEYRAADKQVPFRYQWRSLEAISPNLPHAVIASEDQLFLLHAGIDYEALQKVRQENKLRKRARGASTLTQQVAKNAFLWPGRSWVRKGLETYFTFLIELTWPKRRIAEVYLNIAEWGTGVYGAEAAAQHYYKRSAKELNLNQAARLAAVLPNPRRWSPKGIDPFVVGRSQHITKAVGQMRSWGMLPDDLSTGAEPPRVQVTTGK